MRLRHLGVATLLLLFAGGCDFMPRPSLDCPTPVLASAADLHLSLSCAETISYHDTTYFVGCAPIHATRVGKEFLDAGGETRFSGARDVVGLARSKVFLVSGGQESECRLNERLIAAANSFTRFDAGLMRVRVGSEDEKRLARKRAPWVVPGRNEYPQALRLTATVSEQGVTVTNQNRFAWRNCDQIQINDEIDDVWETGDYLDSLASGGTHTWPLDAFDRDHDGIETLSADYLDEIEGLPFIIMCRAPRGLAFGQDLL